MMQTQASVTAASNGAKLIVAAPGASLGAGARSRPVGRIGGVWGVPEPMAGEARLALAAALGPGAQVLGEGASLVVDHDACRAPDGPCDALARWDSLLRSERLGDVEG
ncbi:MAG TPA: hypothetical protein VLI67_10845, partial [Vicinamibacteria bacterium]|nr:hypothetical protein [Vicinamibacteria bacterium]